MTRTTTPRQGCATITVLLKPIAAFADGIAKQAAFDSTRFYHYIDCIVWSTCMTTPSPSACLCPGYSKMLLVLGSLRNAGLHHHDCLKRSLLRHIISLYTSYFGPGSYHFHRCRVLDYSTLAEDAPYSQSEELPPVLLQISRGMPSIYALVMQPL